MRHRRHLLVAALMATVALVTACSSADDGSPLAGAWERTGGDFSVLQGMVVEVDADATSAVITSVPDNPFRFATGDAKWESITEAEDGTYTFDDLVREESTGAESTVEGIITIADDGGSLEIEFPTTGTTQTWTRVP